MSLWDHLGAGWTPGAVGVWSLLGAVLLGWWKGLPAVLDAFERRQSGIELRTEALLDAQAKRFAEQLAAADDRHDECMEGQKALRAEMTEIRRENGELRSIIHAMQQAGSSMQAVVARAITDGHESHMPRALDKLDELKGARE
ncbi:hypothetical protein [Sphingomonas japonica]|uniref:Flagellar hook-basal body complex protein FliE n=1 Tax=Sphingomonas japonica TaxID=511662 RepID=A0ABX0U4W1_9SPHN|nr:hypothetical protein [Sphingomonas japonica]NIJ24844.1 flagellar hook-basal body complex protein FliE [Sphingomonas japonica]